MRIKVKEINKYIHFHVREQVRDQIIGQASGHIWLQVREQVYWEVFGQVREGIWWQSISNSMSKPMVKSTAQSATT